MGNFRQLRVWQHARALAVHVHRVVHAFPGHERYDLGRQLRRSAVSVGSNISEGAGRGTDRDFVRFLYMARGSCLELEFQLQVAADLDLISTRDHGVLREEARQVTRMLNRLIGALCTAGHDVRKDRLRDRGPTTDD